jgi:hypothetical protein
MLQFRTRPTTGKLEFESRVSSHAQNLDKLKTVDGSPDYEAINAYIDDNQEWKTGVKQHYFAAQERKCAYCERMLTDYGDVEHYRPKSAIFKLDKPGKEVPNLNNTKGRIFDKYPKSGAWDSGYWWLAYDWNNYLVSCGLCNQAWKNALFPIRYGHRRRPKKGDESAKDPYLLDPFGSVDPGQHLEFTAGGAIRPRNNSRYGKETIAVCGLSRPSVVASRLEKAQKLDRKLAQLSKAFEDGASLRPILEDIADLGDERWPHAGMVRITFQQSTGWTWEELKDWLKNNPA